MSFAMLREAIGTKRVTVEMTNPSTINDVLQLLSTRYPKLDPLFWIEHKFNKNYLIIQNDEQVKISNLNIVKVNDGDELVILPPTGGG